MKKITIDNYEIKEIGKFKFNSGDKPSINISINVSEDNEFNKKLIDEVLSTNFKKHTISIKGEVFNVKTKNATYYLATSINKGEIVDILDLYFTITWDNDEYIKKYPWLKK